MFDSWPIVSDPTQPWLYRRRSLLTNERELLGCLWWRRWYSSEPRWLTFNCCISVNWCTTVLPNWHTRSQLQHTWACGQQFRQFIPYKIYKSDSWYVALLDIVPRAMKATDYLTICVPLQLNNPEELRGWVNGDHHFSHHLRMMEDWLYRRWKMAGLGVHTNTSSTKVILCMSSAALSLW